MDQLQQARAQIDEIDAKMAALFEQRMQAVGQVAQYKARTGKQVFDPAREALVLEKNTARVQNPELQPYYREFLKKALAVSRAYQHVLIGQDVAAYQGVEGAWSHIALRQLFPFAKAQAYSTWNEVVEAVERGDAYCGVLPFENSNAGDVSAVLDLLYAHPGLKVARMCDLPIRQDLLALPGAQETVLSRWPVYSDIDVNQHVNNARYADWACDALGFSTMREYCLKTMCIQYAAEIRPGQEISLHAAQSEGRYRVAGYHEGKMHFEIGGELMPRQR